LTPARVIFDSSTGWSGFTSELCDNCNSQVYNPSEDLQVSNETQELVFYQNRFEGIKYYDKLCLRPNESTCIEQNQFALTSQLGLGNADGLVGLSPYLKTSNNSIPFVDELFKEGIIDSA